MSVVCLHDSVTEDRGRRLCPAGPALRSPGPLLYAFAASEAGDDTDGDRIRIMHPFNLSFTLAPWPVRLGLVELWVPPRQSSDVVTLLGHPAEALRSTCHLDDSHNF